MVLDSFTDTEDAPLEVHTSDNTTWLKHPPAEADPDVSE